MTVDCSTFFTVKIYEAHMLLHRTLAFHRVNCTWSMWDLHEIIFIVMDYVRYWSRSKILQWLSLLFDIINTQLTVMCVCHPRKTQKFNPFKVLNNSLSNAEQCKYLNKLCGFLGIVGFTYLRVGGARQTP